MAAQGEAGSIPTMIMIMVVVGCGLCQLCQVLKTRMRFKVEEGFEVAQAVKLSHYF